MSIRRIIIGIIILILSFVAIKQANPQTPEAGAFLIALMITAAIYEWVAGRLNVR